MKMQVFTISVPTDRPLISENVQVVRLSDVKAELALLEKQAQEWRDSAEEMRERYSRHPRFKAAFNYWYGQYTACDGLLHSIRRFFK